MERECKGIFIPISLWENKVLSWNEKILFFEIDSFTKQGKDCYLSDEYIADLLGCSISTARRTLNRLIEIGCVRKTRVDGRRRFVESNLNYSFDVQNDRAEQSNLPSRTVKMTEQNSQNERLPIVISNSKELSITNSDDLSNLHKKKLSKDSKETLVFPFHSDEFMSVWSTLVEQPKWKKKTFNALQLSLNKLAKYAEPFAIILMEDAIERNWQGVVFENTDIRYSSWLKEHPKKIENTKQETYWKQSHHLYGIEDFIKYAPFEFEQLLPDMQSDLRAGKKMLCHEGVWEWPEDYPDYEIYQ